MAARNSPFLSVDEFLDAEELAETRHRCYDGEIVEIEGSSLEHAFLSSHVCGVVGANLMLRTGSKRMFVYPDVKVFRGPVETMEGRPNVVTNPVFVAEVLSPETEGFDRGRRRMSTAGRRRFRSTH